MDCVNIEHMFYIIMLLIIIAVGVLLLSKEGKLFLKKVVTITKYLFYIICFVLFEAVIFYFFLKGFEKIIELRNAVNLDISFWSGVWQKVSIALMIVPMVLNIYLARFCNKYITEKWKLSSGISAAITMFIFFILFVTFINIFNINLN